MGKLNSRKTTQNFRKTSSRRHPFPHSVHSVIPSPSPRLVSERIAEKLARRAKENAPPTVDSFTDFLTRFARVKSGAGYAPYHFAGREALRGIVERLDAILASGETDASLAICGGAQFGKTVLMLNLLAYLVAVRFRNVGYYLPDDDLVAGLVDGKLRPDVLDQIPWLARLISVGKTLSPTGRAVNRKGAFLCTDGQRTALAFMRGLGKIPTSFSMDVVVQDEKDDLPEEHARFLAGRMTASNLRLSLLIGTQRFHGAGQNLAFMEGSQHVGLVACRECGKKWNPETEWPGVCRLQVEGVPSREWPRLTREGHFLPGGTESAPPGRATPFSPGQAYALCCPDCGGLLDREHPVWHAQAPEREVLRRWSFRISQLLIPAIELEQIVVAWQQAIRDPAQMAVFCTDRLALPRSATQTLTPAVLESARGDFELACSTRFPVETVCYGGLDMGDQCWFVARSVEAKAPYNVRLIWAEPIAAERVRARVPELFRMLGLRALCVDAWPLRDLARDVAFELNRTDGTHRTDGTDETGKSYSSHPSHPSYNLRTERWCNARAACVEFTQREGQGLRHKIGRTVEGREYPLLAANRDEAIERAVQELLPPGVGDARLVELPDGTAAAAPTKRFWLQVKSDATRGVLDLYERHLLAGARQERSADDHSLRYVDKCENHFLLATAYAALAELLAPFAEEPAPVLPAFRAVPMARGGRRGLDG